MMLATFSQVAALGADDASRLVIYNATAEQLQPVLGDVVSRLILRPAGLVKACPGSA
jgi:hypothetical protein